MSAPVPVTDTSPATRAVLVEIWRRLGPDGRLRQAAESCESVRELVRAGIRQRHPEYDDRRVQLALYRQLLGADLYRKAFPADDVIP